MHLHDMMFLEELDLSLMVCFASLITHIKKKDNIQMVGNVKEKCLENPPRALRSNNDEQCHSMMAT